MSDNDIPYLNKKITLYPRANIKVKSVKSWTKRTNVPISQ